MVSHLPTLLLREWMQHKRGWLVAAFAPALLFLVILPFGKVHGMPAEHPDLMVLAGIVISAVATWGIAMLVALFQLPGLARRDAQDRSIEFWLSLPGGHGESIGAMVLAHGLLAPLGSLLVGVALGFPAVAMLVGYKLGLLAEVSWGPVLAALPPLLLRGVLGSVLCLLWLSPVIFTLMAASAWLKRLGVPLVLGGGAVLLAVLHKVYEIDWPLDRLLDLNEQINSAMVSEGKQLAAALHDGTDLWAWAGHDAAQALGQLASLQFLGWAAVAAAGFALLVVKRGRIA